jgi:prevent-host-death family protein
VKRATTSQIKNHLSDYLARVRRGQRVTVYNRDRPVAMIVPFDDAAHADRDPVASMALDELERRGGLRRGIGPTPESLLDPPQGAPCGAVAALIQEREEGW